MASTVAALALTITLAILLAIGASVALYVLGSIGLYTMAKNRGSHHAWFAWFPTILRNYLLGELTGDRMWGFEGSKWILAFGPLVFMALSATVIGAPIAVVGGLVYVVYYFMVLFKLFKIYAPKNAELYLITSIVFNFMAPIWCFVIRNNVPDMDVVRDTAQRIPSESDNDYGIYGDIETRNNNPYVDYTQEMGKETEAPYRSVREALRDMNLGGYGTDSDTITIKAMGDEEVADIDSKVQNISDNLKNFIDYDGNMGFDMGDLDSEEPSSDPDSIELHFGDE